MLDLHSSSRVHPVVHVSMLRPYFITSENEQVQPLPSDVDLCFEISISEGRPISMVDEMQLSHTYVMSFKDFVLSEKRKEKKIEREEGALENLK